MVANSPTKYLNSKGRRIFQGAKGGFFARAADGKKIYKPKAAFRKVGGEGAQVKITKTRNNTTNIPSPLRPKLTRAAGVKSYRTALVGRKVRANKGVARGVRSGTLQRRMNAAAARRRVALARPRKVRANKGVARGVRSGTLQRRMNAEAARRRARSAARRVAGPVVRKKRANAGVKRKTRTPTEAALYQMIFGPEKKAITALKAMIVSPGGTTYRSKAAATRARKKRVSPSRSAAAKR